MSSQKKDKRPPKDKPAPQSGHSGIKSHKSAYGSQGELAICVNAQCKLRKQGCRGFEGCPGYTSR